MFKSGGLNVYPHEIEIVVESHPSIAIAAVISVPDETYSEIGVAFVVCEPQTTVTDEELRAWCKERLAGYKVPKSFFVREDVPLLPIGKIDKQKLKKQLLDAE